MTQSETEISALVEGLVRLLDVAPSSGERAAGDAGRADGTAHFIGPRKPGGIGRVFGGQVIGQAMMAAARSVPEDRPIHSLHAYFMRPGSEDHDIDYAVDADMDGRAFSNRRVVARQQGKPILNMTASFHLPEPGLVHQMPMPEVEPPEQLMSFADYVDLHPHLASPLLRQIISRPSAFDYRPVTELTPRALERPHPGQAFCWIKVGTRPLDIPQIKQRALLAWVSDTLLLASAFRAHGIQIGMGGYQSASLDHAMWFHEDVQCGDWLLYAILSPWTGDARGISFGRFFTREGRLVASVAQEGLMRPV